MKPRPLRVAIEARVAVGARLTILQFRFRSALESPVYGDASETGPSHLCLARLICVSIVHLSRLICVPTRLTFSLIGLRFAVLPRPHNKDHVIIDLNLRKKSI